MYMQDYDETTCGELVGDYWWTDVYPTLYEEHQDSGSAQATAGAPAPFAGAAALLPRSPIPSQGERDEGVVVGSMAWLGRCAPRTAAEVVDPSGTLWAGDARCYYIGNSGWQADYGPGDANGKPQHGRLPFGWEQLPLRRWSREVAEEVLTGHVHAGR